MAKKAAKKAGKKAAKKTGKKATAKKAGRQGKVGTATKQAAPGGARGGKKTGKKAGKKTAKRSARRPRGPVQITTGKGPTPKEIGDAVVESVNAGKPDKELWDKYWHPQCVSIEGFGIAYHGMKAILQKNQDWMASHIIHGGKATGPYVGATGFTVHFQMDVEEKDKPDSRRTISEVGVYTVKNGKVVQEEFMYA